MIDKLVQSATNKPKLLFLVDGLGALLTALLLALVLVKLEWFFGIPSSMLYILAVMPIFYMIFDYYCYNKVNLNISKYLKTIASLNLLYCFVSIAFSLFHYQDLRLWGWLYIIGEITIIVSLSIFEFFIAKRIAYQAI